MVELEEQDAEVEVDVGQANGGVLGATKTF
jgi:hypothetical protein